MGEENEIAIPCKHPLHGTNEPRLVVEKEKKEKEEKEETTSMKELKETQEVSQTVRIKQ